MWRNFVMSIVVLVLAGCAVLHSSTDPADGGIPYYLPKTVLTLTIKSTAEEGSVQYFIDDAVLDGSGATQRRKTRAETVPDLRTRYTLTYDRNALYSDRLCIATSRYGLLNSIEYATEDATPQIVLALAELGQKTIGLGGARGREYRRRALLPKAAEVTVTFDPFDKEEVEAAERVDPQRTGHQDLDRFPRNSATARISRRPLRRDRCLLSKHCQDAASIEGCQRRTSDRRVLR